VRDHDVTMLTAAELDGARRELAASLALARPRRTRPPADPGPHQRHRRRAGRTEHPGTPGPGAARA
jgi:hypothetical protein